MDINTLSAIMLAAEDDSIDLMFVLKVLAVIALILIIFGGVSRIIRK